VISASQMLERFLFPPAVQYTPVAKLSGGERRRLHLLLVLMEAPNILLLDEPTNDLDIATLAALEEYLDTFDGVLIVVSHDRWFLDRTIDHLLHFEGDGTIREYPGDYSAWLEVRKQEKQIEDAAARKKKANATAASPKTAPSQSSSGPKKLSYKEKKELEETELRIEAAEERKAAIESELGAGITDMDTITALSEELGALMDALEIDMERWAELAERA